MYNKSITYQDDQYTRNILVEDVASVVHEDRGHSSPISSLMLLSLG